MDWLHRSGLEEFWEEQIWQIRRKGFLQEERRHWRGISWSSVFLEGDWLACHRPYRLFVADLIFLMCDTINLIYLVWDTISQTVHPLLRWCGRLSQDLDLALRKWAFQFYIAFTMTFWLLSLLVSQLPETILGGIPPLSTSAILVLFCMAFIALVPVIVHSNESILSGISRSLRGPTIDRPLMFWMLIQCVGIALHYFCGTPSIAMLPIDCLAMFHIVHMCMAIFEKFFSIMAFYEESRGCRIICLICMSIGIPWIFSRLLGPTALFIVSGLWGILVGTTMSLAIEIIPFTIRFGHYGTILASLVMCAWVLCLVIPIYELLNSFFMFTGTDWLSNWGRPAALIEGSCVLSLLVGKAAFVKAEILLWPGMGRVEWFVPGNLNGFRVSAIPDTGSDLDIVSSDFVRRHGIKIDSSCAQSIRLPNGVTRSIGSISLPFTFDGEESPVHRVFTVLPNCLHDVILSNTFLKTTETLTKFSRRLKSQFVPLLHGPRLRLLGTPKQRIWGSINGHTVGAIPDTGSDVMLMSKRYAKKLRLDIRREDCYKTRLEFADGTLANTYGMACGVEWRFGGKTSTPRFCDFHVMDDLPYKVILSNNFLFKSEAFSRYKDFFFEQQNDRDLNRAFHELSLIKVVGGQNKTLSRLHGYYRQLVRVIRRNSTNGGSQMGRTSLTNDREYQLRRELQRQDLTEEAIEELSPDQQNAAWAAERRLREQWIKNHPPILNPLATTAGSHDPQASL